MSDPGLPEDLVKSAELSLLTPSQVGREFRGLLERGVALRPSGTARTDPSQLLRRGYTPHYRLRLAGTTYYLTKVRQNPDIRFFVAYVRVGGEGPREDRRKGQLKEQRKEQRKDQGGALYPRIFYKDVSLVWRSASHFVRSEQENWIGKGELRPYLVDGEEVLCSAEETTDLPFEIQGALESLIPRGRPVPTDHRALGLVLRRGPDDRLAPYRDFTAPRERARKDRRNLINGGGDISRFTRRNDPTSLVFVRGYAPDFDTGVIREGELKSRLYGGVLKRFRIFSANRKIQYLFFAGPHHVWIIPPQTLSTDITSYGVRAIDVPCADDLCVPGYEYHFIDEDEDPPKLFSQIPEGYAGAPSELDPARCDASPWIDRLPVIREFRRRVLGERGSRRPR